MRRALRFTLVLFVLLAPLSAPAAQERLSLPLEGSPSQGPGSAPVTIVEFIDFQ